MLDQVRNAFPGAEVQHFHADTFLVAIAGRCRAFRHTPEGWKTEEAISRAPAPLEDLRDAWYKALKDEARKNLDDLRAALRVPEAPPKAPVWGDLVFEEIPDIPGILIFQPRGWRCPRIGLRVVQQRRKPQRWRASLNDFQAYGETPSLAMDSLVRSLKDGLKSTAQDVLMGQRRVDSQRSTLKLLGLAV